MKSVILLKQAGKNIPDEHLNKVFHELAPVCLGIAAVADNDGVDIVAMDHWHDLKEIGKDWSEILKAIDEAQEALKDNQALFQFSDNAGMVSISGDEVETNYMQPYALLHDGDGNVKLIGCLRGDFSPFAQAGSAHPEEYFATQEELLPRLMEKYRLLSEDMDKLTSDLRSSAIFKKDLQKLSLGDTGVITLFAANGELLTFPAKDGLCVEEDWGWTTLGTDKAQEAKKEEKPTSQIASRLFSKLKKPAPAPTPVAEAPKKEQPKPAPTETKIPDKVTTAPALTVPESEFVQCPPHIDGKNARREWYQKHAGYVPQGYKNRPRVEVKREALKDFKDLGKVANTGTAAAEPEKPKDTATKNIPPSQGPVSHGAPSSAATKAMIIPAEIKEKIKKDDLVIKTLDQSSQRIPSNEEIQAIEEKFSSFSEQTGIDLENLFFWKPQDFEHFLYSYPETAVSLVTSLLASYARQLGEGKGAAPPTSVPASPKTKLSMPKRAAAM